MEFEALLGIFGGKIDKVNRHLSRIPGNPVWPVLGGSAVSPGPTTPFPVVVNGYPAAGRTWNVRVVGVFGNDDHTPIIPPSVIHIPVTAGTAATATIELGGAIQGFDVTLVAGGTAAGTVKVMNVAGQAGSTTLTYDIPVGATSVSIRYPTPIQPASVGTSITVVLSAITGGGAGNIDVYVVGASLNGAGIATVYSGTPVDPSVPPAMTDIIAPAVTIPSVTTFPRHAIYTQPREQVFAMCYGIPTGQQVVLVTRVEEYKLADVEALSIHGS